MWHLFETSCPLSLTCRPSCVVELTLTPLCSLGKKLLSAHPEGSFLGNGAQLSPSVSVRFGGVSPSGTKLDAPTPSRSACAVQRAWRSSARAFLLLHSGSGGLGGGQGEHLVMGTGYLWLRLGARGVLQTRRWCRRVASGHTAHRCEAAQSRAPQGGRQAQKLCGCRKPWSPLT